jgi:valyl-tRNA synthetase
VDCAVFIQAHDGATFNTISEQQLSIKSLIGKGVGSIGILSPEDSRPPGCVVFPVASAATVFLHVKGRVDINAELEKVNAKLGKISAAIEKQSKLLADSEYSKKVSATVQEADRKRLVELEAQASSFAETVKQFEHLKLEQ